MDNSVALLSNIPRFHTLSSQKMSSSQQKTENESINSSFSQSITESQIIYPENVINRRIYQIKTSARSLVSNSLIILPKKLGKTTILMLDVYNFRNSEKIVFVSNDSDSIQSLSSFFSVEPLNRPNIQENKLLWQSQPIIFCSINILFNAISNNLFEPFDPSLLIFDDISIGDLCKKEKSIISNITPSKKKTCRIIGTTSTMPNDKKQIQEIITNMKIEQIIFYDITGSNNSNNKSDEIDDILKYVPKAFNFIANDFNTDTLVESLDKINQKYIDFLFDKGCFHTNQADKFTNKFVFSALCECQNARKKLSIDIQNTFNILLQLTSIRDKLVNFGPGQAYAALETLTKKKMTDQRKKLLNSPQYKNFVQLLDNSRDKLHPKFASVAKIVKDTLKNNTSDQSSQNSNNNSQKTGEKEKTNNDNSENSSSDVRIVILASLEDTCKCIVAFLKQKNTNDTEITIKPSFLKTKTKHDKLMLFQTGQINVIVTTFENLILVKKIKVTLYILFDQPNNLASNLYSNSSSSLAGKNVVALQPDPNFLNKNSTADEMTDETRQMLKNPKDYFQFWSKKDEILSKNAESSENDKPNEANIHPEEKEKDKDNFNVNKESEANSCSEEKSGVSSPERPLSFVQGSELLFTQDQVRSQANFNVYSRRDRLCMDDGQNVFARSQNVYFRSAQRDEKSGSSYGTDSIYSNSCGLNRLQSTKPAFSQPLAKVNRSKVAMTHSQSPKIKREFILGPLQSNQIDNSLHMNEENKSQDPALTNNQEEKEIKKENTTQEEHCYLNENSIQNENNDAEENSIQNENCIPNENHIEEEISIPNENHIQEENPIPCENCIQNENFVAEEENCIQEEISVPDEKFIMEENCLPNENFIKEENCISNENFIPNENHIQEENCVPTENHLQEEIPIPNENCITEENSIHNENIINKENCLPDEKCIPEENLIHNENFLPNENIINQENCLPNEKCIPEENLIHNENCLPNESLINEDQCIPSENYLPSTNCIQNENCLPEENCIKCHKQSRRVQKKHTFANQSSSQPTCHPLRTLDDFLPSQPLLEYMQFFSQGTSKAKHTVRRIKTPSTRHQHHSIQHQCVFKKASELIAQKDNQPTIINELNQEQSRKEETETVTHFLDDSSFTDDEYNYLETIENTNTNTNTAGVKNEPDESNSEGAVPPKSGLVIDTSNLPVIQEHQAQDSRRKLEMLKETQMRSFLSSSDSEIDEFYSAVMTQKDTKAAEEYNELSGADTSSTIKDDGKQNQLFTSSSCQAQLITSASGGNQNRIAPTNVNNSYSSKVIDTNSLSSNKVIDTNSLSSNKVIGTNSLSSNKVIDTNSLSSNKVIGTNSLSSSNHQCQIASNNQAKFASENRTQLATNNFNSSIQSHFTIEGQISNVCRVLNQDENSGSTTNRTAETKTRSFLSDDSSSQSFDCFDYEETPAQRIIPDAPSSSSRPAGSSRLVFLSDSADDFYESQLSSAALNEAREPAEGRVEAPTDGGKKKTVSFLQDSDDDDYEESFGTMLVARSASASKNENENEGNHQRSGEEGKDGVKQNQNTKSFLSSSDDDNYDCF